VIVRLKEKAIEILLWLLNKLDYVPVIVKANLVIKDVISADKEIHTRDGEWHRIFVSAFIRSNNLAFEAMNVSVEKEQQNTFISTKGK